MEDSESYSDANEAKANFDDVYTGRTPHLYIAEMAKLGYEIGEQARPYCTAAAELLRERNSDAWPVQMLDLGCSYGIGSAFVKYGCSFDEMVAFFASRAPKEYSRCCEATRMWLNITPPICDLRSVGLDSAEQPIQFAMDSGLIDGGIARDFENPDAIPTEEERAWLRSCNLLISTGAVGYITERTVNIVLEHLGRDNPSEHGPLAVITVLRIFDVEPIRHVFEQHHLKFGAVTGVRLPQRMYLDEEEHSKMLDVLHNKGIDTEGWEDTGKHFADLYIAAPPNEYPALLEQMNLAHSRCESSSAQTCYICR